MTKVINVFIIDDSALVRKAFSAIINNAPSLYLIGTAADPLFAETKFAKTGYPDVLILDLEMPRMDGLTYLRKIMIKHPLPVIICSGNAEKGSSKAIEALSAGAIDIINKPKLGVSSFLDESRQEIVSCILAAYNSKIVPKIPSTIVKKVIDTNISFLRESKYNTLYQDKIIVIGSSTGGVQVLETILKNLIEPVPPIIIVQHMPKGFTKSLADRLDRSVDLTVREAEEGMLMEQNQVIIAAGDKHLKLVRSFNKLRVSLLNGPKINHHRPSIDVLFNSCADLLGRRTVAFLLTGMGKDGAYGLLNIKKAGGHTFAQNEESCVVYGMPQEAVKLDAAEKSVTPLEMSNVINRILN